jgi:predicted  nucleic acid-binding Zn-ribbon protein
MTIFKPTLIVNQLAIFKDGNQVFDCSFHVGVNIISGHNSSGKTTILDFISYALGAENIPWKQEALLCDTVFVQVSLNGKKVTFRRDVNTKPLNPLHIFWGALSNALSASFNDWETYPFRRSTNKISFTQAILLALDLSEAQGEGASNLTMHQFLRVLYADQPSLHSPIFRTDSFDTALNRETIGNYLCGVYDDRLYSAQLEKRALEKSLDQLSAELKSIFSVLARSQQDVSLDFFTQAISNAEVKRNDLTKELSNLKEKRALNSSVQRSNEENPLRLDLNKAKKTLADATSELTKIELEVVDSNKFIDEISFRLRSIDESKLTRDFLGNIDFSFCPCCLNEIPSNKDNSSSCSLCKTQLNEAPADTQILRMKNELRIQLHESKMLMEERVKKVSLLRSEIPDLKQNLKNLEARYLENASTWSTEIEFSIEELARKLGGIDQEIKSLYEQQKLSLVIQDLQTRKNKLQERLVEVDSTIEKLEFSQDARRAETHLVIADILGKLLRQDLYRQEEFRTAESISFSFSDNQISVQGATKFSESSTVVLRHLFHVALLSASAKLPHMRLPRFLILDGIEDGGMELERSHLLQEIIVKECESIEVDYQLILATSQISPNLDKESFVVGRSFTEEKRSLQILGPN